MTPSSANPLMKERTAQVSLLARILLLAVIVGIGAASFMITRAHDWPAFLERGVIQLWAAYGLFPLIALVFNRLKRPVPAVWTLLLGLQAVLLLIDLRMAAYGMIGLVVLPLLAVFISAHIRFTSRQAAPLIVESAVVGLLVLALDWGGSPARPVEAEPYQVLVGVVLAAVVLILSALTLRGWSRFRLSTKFIATFIALSILSVASVGIIVSLIIRGTLTQDAGRNLNALAQNKATALANQLDREQDMVLSLSLNRAIFDTVDAINGRYRGEGPDQVDAQIRELNRQWKRSDKNDPSVRAVLDNPAARELDRFRENFQDNAQLVVVDRNGGLVGSTHQVDRFYFGDQDWFQKAYKFGYGDSFTSQPAYFPDLELSGIVFAAPVRDPDTRRIVGVLQAVFDLQAVAGQLDAANVGTTGDASLIFQTGQVMKSDGSLAFLGSAEIMPLLSITGDYDRLSLRGQDTLVSRAAVMSTQAAGASLNALGMQVIVQESAAEALRAADEAGRAPVLAGILAVGMATLLALITSYFLARPITRLTLIAAQVTEGDLAARAPVDSGDEIGSLAAAFNRMTGQLKQTLDTLEQRVADRTAELAGANAQLEHHSEQLEASAEVSRAAASTLDLQVLLQSVTRLLAERFGFYHAAIYLLDETGQQAVLRTAFCADENRALAPGTVVAVGATNFIGNVTATGKARLSGDLRQDALGGHRPFDECQTEITLPLRVADRIIGAVDLLDVRTRDLSESDTAIIRTLSDQLAVAIQNARSYSTQLELAEENRKAYVRQAELTEENRIAYEREAALADENRKAYERQAQLTEENRQAYERQAELTDENRKAYERQAQLTEENRQAYERQAQLAEENRLAYERQAQLTEENRRLYERSLEMVDELNALTRRLTGESWDVYLQAQEQEITVQDGAYAVEEDEQAKAALARAADTGRMVAASNGQSTLALPILLRGEVIGSLALEDENGERQWQADDIGTVQQVADHLALALDNARLYSTAQLDLAERVRAEAALRDSQDSMRKQNEYLNALHDVSLGLISRHDVNRLLEDVVSHAAHLVGTEHGYVFLLDRDRDEIEMRIGVGIYKEFMGSRQGRSGGLAGMVWNSGEPVVLDDYQKWEHRIPHPSRDRLHAVVGVPLKSGGEVAGVIGLAHLEETRRFGPAEMDVLTRFAQLAALALDNAQLIESSQERLAEVTALNAISQTMSSQLDLDVLVQAVGEQVRQLFKVQSGYLALVDHARGVIEFPYFVNDGQPARIDPTPLGKGLTSHVIRTREPVLLLENTEEKAKGLEAIAYGSPSQSYLGVPIISGNQVIGVLSVQSSDRPRAFSESQTRLLTTIASGVGIAIQNARLYRDAQSRAKREQLTREIVGRVSRSINETTILQTTARQLGRALGTSHVIIRLNPNPVGNGGDDGRENGKG